MKTRAQHAVVITCAVVLTLSFAISGCKKKVPDNSAEQSRVQAEKKITVLIDDFFAYIKMGLPDKMGEMVEGSGELPEEIAKIRTCAYSLGVSSICSRMSAEILDVTVDADAATARISMTYPDHGPVLEHVMQEGAYESDTKLSEAIDSAPIVSEELTLSLVLEDRWLMTSDSLKKIFEPAFSFLLDEELVTDMQQTTPVNDPDISVYDFYFVDSNGNETAGYHASDKMISLYVYTWNTYSNLPIKYQYEDQSGGILYENTFVIKNNSDWIACSWRPAAELSPGIIYCKLYLPSGNLFHTAQTTIYPDDRMIPFPLSISSCGWVDAEGREVLFYHAEDGYIEYTLTAMQFYKDLELTYRFLDEEGEVLFEGQLEISDLTDTFRFIWEEEEGLETEGKIYLEVYTSQGNPFCSAEILVVKEGESEEN